VVCKSEMIYLVCMGKPFYRRIVFFGILFLFITEGLRAQAPDSMVISRQTADSIIALLSTEEYDSLMTELDDLFSFITKKETSYADVSLTAGNGNFTLRNIDAASSSYKITNRLVVSPSAGYFHKSGVGAQWSSFFAGANGSLKPYQHQASFFYDYLKGKKISLGISYSRLFTDGAAVDFFTSPFKNNYNIYAALKKGRLKPSVSFNYSSGSYTDVFVRPLFTLYYKVNITEFATTASLRYSFTKKGWLTGRDYLLFTPRIALISSGQKAVTANPDNNIRLNRLLANGLVPQRSVSSFQPQVMALYLSADYILGKWYLHPQLYIDYYLHTADRRSFSSFSITTGFLF
jgi:hypothetical protein